MILARREKIISAVALILILVTMGDSFLITPRIKAWRELSGRLKETQNSFAKAQAVISKEDQLRRRWENLIKFSRQSEKKDLQSLFTKYLDEVAKKAKVTFTSLTLVRESETDEHHELVFSIEVTSPISGVSKFLYYLDISSELIKTMDLNISSPPNSTESINVQMKISMIAIKKKT